MIRDAQGRRWKMRFKQYRNGWHWEARHENHGQSATEMFATKELAEADARWVIQSHDSIAAGAEYFRRLTMRGTVCSMTPEDHDAIAGQGATISAKRGAR
jgi:hypothetical protein